MKPIRIEPSDIRITAEHSVKELKEILAFIRIAIPLVTKVYGNTDQEEAAEMLSVVDRYKDTISEIMEHPLIKGL